MRRTWFLIATLAAAALTVACGSDDHHVADAKIDSKPIDAPVDGAGSGSNLAFAIEPSPPDHGLELMVAVTSMVIVVGPVRGTRRRRKHDDAAPRT